MAIYKRDIVDIDLSTGNIHRTFMAHTIGYKDQKADHFGVRVFRDGEAVSLTGVSVQGVFMPPQGSPIAITSGNIVSGNTAEVVLPQACYDYNGQFCLAIKLVDSSNSVTGTVRIVDGVVDNTHASGTVAPTSAVPTYQEVLSAYEQAIAVIGSSVRFDTTQSLTTAQKTTARGNIDAASTDDVSALKSAFDNKIGKTNIYNIQDYQETKYFGANESVTVSRMTGGLSGNVGDQIEITSSQSYNNAKVDCEESKLFWVCVSASNSASYPYYAMATDQNGIILERFMSKRSIDSYLTEIISVPDTAKYLYVMSVAGDYIKVKKMIPASSEYIKSVNLLPPYVNEYGYFDTGTNKWIASASSRQSEPIAVTPGETLYYNSTIDSWVAFFDSSMGYVTRVLFSHSTDVSLPSEITVPSNNSIAFMSVTLSTNYENVENMMITRIPTPQRIVKYNEIKLKSDTLTGKKIMVFGDSISFKQIRWFSTFLANTQPDQYVDYAVNGCQWCDTRYDTTYPYQGNPSADDSNNNVMGNQVQKAINEHAFDPDYILMFCGTNDNFRYDADTTMEQQFTDSEGDAVPLANVQRYTLAGSMRWCVENLKTEFPSARIIIITPIQCAYGVRKMSIQMPRNERILETAHRLGCIAFDAFSESGVYSGFETSGQMGEYLVDGLHPYPPTGGKLIGNYISNKMMAYVSSVK